MAEVPRPVKGSAAWLIALAMLAGCADAPPEATPTDTPADGLILAGIVQDSRFQPIVGAEVTLNEMNLTDLTGPSGRFSFPEIPAGVYSVTAVAEGFVNLTIPISPTFDGELLFQLDDAADPVEIFTDSYTGRLQCAAEYIIISGSCDRVITEFGGPGLFSETAQFLHGVTEGWATIVVDVSFDPANLQGFEALRVSTKAGDSADELGSYERFARHSSGESFTFRIEPNQTYEGGDAPVPMDIDALLFDVFAQGNGYGTVCVPEQSPQRPGDCFTGIGVGIDLEFDLLVTSFYGAPAPEGYSLL